MASTDRQRWARVLPALAWKHPGLPTTWTRVLERNPEAMNLEPLPGYVWLDGPGKVLHDPATALVVILSAARKPLRSAQDDAPFFPQWPSRRLDTPRHSAP
jgi:hypothetical protein